MVLLEAKFGILIFCAVLMFVNLEPSMYLDSYVVEIEGGPIIGKDNINNYAFKGIPYAEAKRFAPPQPFARKWRKILSFDKYGSLCAQYDQFSYSYVGLEDCLSLNVFVPKSVVKSDQLLPVIVFIHGGAFMYGGGEFYGQDIIMEQQNFILVTINYRLGVLGFLSTEDEIIPGNLGLKDQVEALKWIQRNIHAFNGDKSNVTITGFSAGGASVHLHNLSPMSRGLFKNGISHSGVALNPWVMQENARKKAFQVGNSLGCKNSSNSKKLLKCLKKVPARDLVMSAKLFQPFLYNPFSPFGVVVEDKHANAFLTDQPKNIINNKKFKGRPWIISVTKDEGLYPVAEFYNNDTLQLFDKNWNDLAPFLLDFNGTTDDKGRKLEWSKAIRKFYFKDEKISIENFNDLTKLFTDRLFKNGFYDAAIMQSLSTKIYCYYFEFPIKASIAYQLNNSTNFLGVSHGDDVFLIYNNQKLREYTIDEKKIGKDLLEMYRLFNAKDEGNFADKEIVPSDGKTVKCMDIKSPTNYSINSIFENLETINFWKSLNILE